MKSSVLITGLTRQSAKYIEKQILDIENKMLPFFDVKFFVVESDSKDATVEILSELKANKSNFEFITLGDLESNFPNRFSRLTICRNEYIDYFKRENKNFNWNYVFVMDLDEINNQLRGKNIYKSLKRIENWDVITANQIFGYYDLLALRCTGWCERDIFDELSEAISCLKPEKNPVVKFLIEDRLRKRIIYKKMKIIPPWSSEIPVSSAFGGFGIYKSWIFSECDYGSEEAGKCEHLEFNRKIVEKGGTIFILPSLINNISNDYTLNKLFLVRLIKFLIKKTRRRTS